MNQLGLNIFLKFISSRSIQLLGKYSCSLIICFVLASLKSFGATYYSYQSGDWAASSTWTTDPSGTLSVNSGIPVATDNIVILNGRIVTISSGSKTVATLQINYGGTLDITTTTGHNFGTVSGQGLLRLNSNTFPSGTYTSFVASTGGTVEYYNLNNTRISNTQLTYNNLLVSNYSASANTVFIDNASSGINYTINGNFDLKNNSTGSLSFNFGNSTASDNLLNLTVNGNFTVSSGCTVGVNNFSTAHNIPNSTVIVTPPVYSDYPVHTLFVYGNLTNCLMP